MKIETFENAKRIQDELLTLKIALSAMYSYDECGMAPAFDIGALPKGIKEKTKPILSERIEELENEFDKLSESED